MFDSLNYDTFFTKSWTVTPTKIIHPEAHYDQPMSVRRPTAEALLL